MKTSADFICWRRYWFFINALPSGDMYQAVGIADEVQT
jgi:hypothetical protein